MTRSLGILLLLLATAGSAHAEDTKTLLEARKGHTTKLSRKAKDTEALPAPHPQLFSSVSFTTPLGKMAAYLSKPPKPGVKYPAMVWVTGGFPAGGIGESAWKNVDSDNDQSAKAYREAGMIMMYPTFRGTSGNPGTQESFYGEVDDVIAAGKYLSKLDYVDPKRIYLGGHSTGGTLVLLVAEATSMFKAVFSFGPVADTAVYGAESLTYDPKDAREAKLRAPIHYLQAIRTPTYVMEGTKRGNIDSVHKFLLAKKSTKLKSMAVQGASHFDVLFPVNRLIAKKIAALQGDADLSLNVREVQSAFTDHVTATREAGDLRTLANVRAAGVDLNTASKVSHYFYSREQAGLKAAAKAAKALGYSPTPIQARKDRRGRAYYVLVVNARLTLGDLKAVFALSKTLKGLASKHELDYDGWHAG
jgi:dienelactone hydrolase